MVFDRWHLPVAGGLSLCLEKRIFGRFKPFSLRSYIIYQPKKENAADAKIVKNNFRLKKCRNFFRL